MGRSQVVRQRILIPPFGGSSPPAPASQSGLHELTYGYRSNVAVPRRFADMARMKFMPLPARIPSQLWLILATLIGGMFLLSDLAPKPTKAANHADAADLGATARQALVDIFRNRDPTAIDRFFSEPFVQHDPNIADGLSGLKAFAAEVASSPTANVRSIAPSWMAT